ncbi:MAG: hypothetical protein WAT09_17360 [Paracoccaceae bacterium]
MTPTYRDMTEDDPPLAYLDGIALDDGGAVIIAAIWGFEDSIDRPTRLLHISADGKVRCLDVEHNIISLASPMAPATAQVYGLTKTNQILKVFPEQGEPVPIGRDRGGRFSRLRGVDNGLVVVGLNGQVSRIKASSAAPFDEGAFASTRQLFFRHLRDVGGHPASRMIAVGLAGCILQRRRDRWEEVDAGTNADLEQIVHGQEADSFWIAGNGGTLIHVVRDEWRFVDAGTEVNFWGMTWLGGKIILSAMEGLFCLDPETEEVTPQDVKTDRPVSFYRVDANSGRLWSIGPQDIVLFDGESWQRIHVPGTA